MNVYIRIFFRLF